MTEAERAAAVRKYLNNMASVIAEMQVLVENAEDKRPESQAMMNVLKEAFADLERSLIKVEAEIISN